MGHHFSIITDHHSVKEILSQSIHTLEQQKYVVKLMSYDFDVSYIIGKTNIVPDVLSQKFCDNQSLDNSSFHSLSFTTPVFQIIKDLR